jgi:hypothetical protein
VNWTALGAVGELLGAVAVVASLLYVARQVKQSNRIARAEAFRAAMLKAADMMEDWCQDPGWTAQFVRMRFQGLRRGDMNAEERAKGGIHMQAMVWMYAAIHRDVQVGILPPSAYETMPSETFRMPYMKEVWPLLREDHSEEFREFFEARFDLPRTSESLSRVPPGTADS